MWRDTPDQRLMYIRQRQSDLMAEAAANRLVATRAARARRFSGVRIRVGALLIGIGRALCEEDALKAHPVR